MNYCIIILASILSLVSFASANVHLALADEHYSKRAEGAYGNMAKTLNIEEAIKNYTLALKDKAVREEAAWKLLRAYYFLGCFTMPKEQNSDRKKHFEKAKNEGKAFFNEFPKSVEVAYWYSVSLALWVRELNSITIVLNMSTLSETRKVANLLIENENDKISAARGYQLLGGLHKKLPNVVPSVNKDSVEIYLNKSLQLNPSDLSTLLILAEYYKDNKKDMEKAKALLKPVLGNKPRAHEFLEDERNFIKMRNLLQ